VRRILFVIVAASMVALGAPAGHAAPTAETPRLKHLHPKAEKYHVSHKGKQQDAGAARIYIEAPVEVTRSVVTDYRRYADMIPRFEQARVLGRRGDKTDVYLRVPILKGAAKIWAVLRFDPPRRVKGGGYVVTATMLKGNVKRFEAVYRIVKINARSSQLHLEMLIEPNFPAPNFVVADQVAGACDNAVRNLRKTAERRQGG
jgi:ribosome-associated toxin RatA of RatAB toxin-antitoxin module